METSNRTAVFGYELTEELTRFEDACSGVAVRGGRKSLESPIGLTREAVYMSAVMHLAHAARRTVLAMRAGSIYVSR